MAIDPNEDVVALVRHLVASGKAFSIALESEGSPPVHAARDRHNFSLSQGDNFSFAQGDGRCIEWMQVPGKGVVCIRHEGDPA